MRKNRAALRAIAILRLLSTSDTALTLTAISGALRIPKSSTFEILHTLVDEGMAEIADTALKTFRAGLGLLEVGLHALSQIDLPREARPLLRELNQSTGETAILAIEDKGFMVCLDRVEGHSVLRTSVKLGARVPMHCTALGKAVLAAYPDAKTLEILKTRRLKRMTSNTIGNIRDLQQELKRIRERGFAIDNQENALNVSCVGAPIYSDRGRVIAAVSVAAPTSSVDSKRLHRFGALVQKTALGISRRLGYPGREIYPSMETGPRSTKGRYPSRGVVSPVAHIANASQRSCQRPTGSF